MSTRASVVIYDEWDEKPICEMFKHWDGYPAGFGQELLDFCADYTIINGIRADETMEKKFANGMGDFAAQLIRHFKVGIGDTSMIPVGKDWGQEYRYIIKCSKKGDAKVADRWVARPHVYVNEMELFIGALKEEE